MMLAMQCFPFIAIVSRLNFPLPLCILVRKRLLLLTLHKIHSAMPEIVDLRKPEAF